MLALTQTRLAPPARRIGRGLLVMSLSLLSGLGGGTALANDASPERVQKVGLQSPSNPSSNQYSRALDAQGGYRITAAFQSVSGSPVSLSFRMEPAVSRSSMQEFGISTAEIEGLRKACERVSGCDQAEFDHRLKQYFSDHKLRLRNVPGQRSHLFVDIPEVVRHNRDHVRPVSEALRELADEQGRDERWMFEAAVGLVQAGLAYRAPANVDAGRQTLGFYTPPRALETGYGDCDTKSALLAAILLNLGYERVIGVRIPDHYLLGIAREPRDGEAFVRYQDQTYVLIEASGPAVRRPGDVSDRTRVALSRGESLRIDPMF
ncbi:hypothetical protein KHP57_15925 [Algiphilus sp. NNCM1]|jgi:hypothetical protein|nr:hypothetical protein [Algiphilus acroporae]